MVSGPSQLVRRKLRQRSAQEVALLRLMPLARSYLELASVDWRVARFAWPPSNGAQ